MSRFLFLITIVLHKDNIILLTSCYQLCVLSFVLVAQELVINILRIYILQTYVNINGLDAYSVHATYLPDEHNYLEGKHNCLCGILCPYRHYMLIYTYIIFVIS